MKKSVAVWLALFTVFALLSGCGKPDKKMLDVSAFDIKKGDETVKEIAEQESIFYRDGETVITYKEVEGKPVAKKLTVCGIGENNTIEDVIKALNIEIGKASFDYEYDPYGDGCTEVGSAVYDGTLPSYEQLSVLDMVLNVYYIQKDGEWTAVDLKSDSLDNYPVILKISFDTEGVHDLYGKNKGEIFSLECAVIADK